MCEHQWEYQGVVYSYGSQLPGSGAHEMIYEDRYFCSKCLSREDTNPRVHGNSYMKPISGTFPK
jgi:hypothetical protein